MGCLIAVVNPDGAPVDTRLLRAMLDVSPYSAGDVNVWTDPGVALGYTPLPNRVERPQPVRCDERFWAVMDGRLDDRRELVRQLERRLERRLVSASDTELVIAAYECWGTDCAAHLFGDFSFCVWDAVRHRLFCARDHLGVKPLYYARVGRTLIVSNVLRSLRRHPDISPRFDDLAICDLLLFGATMEQSRTTFADVARVAPGHTLTYSTGDAVARIHRFWSFQPGDELRLPEPDAYVERYTSMLRTVVADRVADAPIGVLMSGGLDSSSVAATAAGVLGPDLVRAGMRAYTFVYDSVAADHERRYSSLVAQRLGIDIEHHAADGYAWFDRWNDGLLPPEPSIEPMTAMTADLLERASQHGTVVLTGDGGDPALLPSTLVSLIGRTSLGVLARDLWQSGWRTRTLPPIGVRSTLRQWLSSHNDVPAWLSPSFVRDCDPRARLEDVTHRRAPASGRRGMAASAVVDPWWTSMFEAYDPGATQRPVELRYPLFDVRLISLAISLPTHPWCVNKQIVRSAMRGQLPEDVRTRPKFPLSVDLEQQHGRWDADDVARRIEARPELARYVDVQAFRRIRRHARGLTGDEPGMWAVVALATWLHCAEAGVAE